MRIFKSNGTLVIYSTKPADRGEYACEVTTKGFDPVVSNVATLSVIGMYDSYIRRFCL